MRVAGRSFVTLMFWRGKGTLPFYFSSLPSRKGAKPLILIIVHESLCPTERARYFCSVWIHDPDASLLFRVHDPDLMR